MRAFFLRQEVTLPVLLEQLYQTMCANTREAGGLLLHIPPLKVLSIARRQTPGVRTARLYWFLSGGIMANINQAESVGYPFSIVEMKKSDCSATAGGNALDTATVEAKMAIPSLSPWIEEEDGFLCC